MNLFLVIPSVFFFVTLNTEIFCVVLTVLIAQTVMNHPIIS